MGALDSLARFSTRRAPWIVGLSILSLLPAGYLAEQLGFESSLTALLPERYQAVRDLRAGEKLSGGVAHAVIAIDARDHGVAERFADALDQRLRALPEVRFVQSRLDIEFIEQRQLYFLSVQALDELVEELTDELDARKVEAAGLGLGLDEEKPSLDLDLRARFLEEAERLDLPTEPYLYGNDGRYLYLFVAVSGEAGDLGRARVTQSKLEETATQLRQEGGFPSDLELRFSGTLVVRLEDNQILTTDLQRASVLGFLAVVLLLVAYTRRLRTLIVLSVPLVCGLAFTLAFAQLTFGRLNIISGFLVSILSGLGIEFGIHLLLRHLEERGRGLDPEAAQIEAMRTTGRSLLGSAGTNAGAFFVVSLAGFEGFSEFGLIAGVGLLLTAIISLLVFPAVNVLLERLSPMRVPPIRENVASELHVPSWVKGLVLIGLPLLCAYSLFALSTEQVRFRTNWREIKGESPASDFDEYISKSLGMTFTQTMVFVERFEDLPKVEKVVARAIERRQAARLPSGISGTFSLADLLPSEQTEKQLRIQGLAGQLRRIDREGLAAADRERLDYAFSLTEAPVFGLEDLPASLSQRFRTTTGEGSLLIIRSNYQFYESSEVAEWADEMSLVHEELVAAGFDAPIVSENWIAGTVFQIIYADGPFILGGTLLIVFLVILLDLRRVSYALIVLGTLLVGFISIAGGMALLGMELNFINSAVLPLVIGVSIDNSLHIFHRYVEDGPNSIPVVLRYTVSATTLSSAANLMGFGSMIIAHHKGLRSVAELAILGITLTFVSTSIYLPLVLERWGRLLVRVRPMAGGH